LPTGFGFPEDILKGGARRLIADAKFDCSGSKCFSRDEMKCQSSLCWRQAKVAPQTINALVHDEIRDDLTWHTPVPLLSRNSPFRGLVTLRQTFARRSH
jgi:hypothetical protein